jgi:hypothetical protein
MVKGAKISNTIFSRFIIKHNTSEAIAKPVIKCVTCLSRINETRKNKWIAIINAE